MFLFSRLALLGTGGSMRGILRPTRTLLPWWNYSTEQRHRKIVQGGGTQQSQRHPSTHKIYVKKYRKNHFPNRGRGHKNVAMVGVTRQRPHRMGWPYDMNSLIFNSQQGADKIGFVVGTKMLKTAVVAANYMVYFPKYNQRVARTGRYFAQDEDMACVEGDLVHIKSCRKLSKYKHYYVFSILEPNIEGRERLKLGLPVRPPELFGYPSTRRVMKINLTSKSQSKETLAAAMQEQVSQFYKFGGQAHDAPVFKGVTEQQNISFEEAHKIVAPVAESRPSELPDGGAEVPLMEPSGSDFTELEGDLRQRKADRLWSKNLPAGHYDIDETKKSP